MSENFYPGRVGSSLDIFNNDSTGCVDLPGVVPPPINPPNNPHIDASTNRANQWLLSIFLAVIVLIIIILILVFFRERRKCSKMRTGRGQTDSESGGSKMRTGRGQTDNEPGEISCEDPLLETSNVNQPSEQTQIVIEGTENYNPREISCEDPLLETSNVNQPSEQTQIVIEGTENYNPRVDTVFQCPRQILPGGERMAEESDVDTTPGDIHRKLLDHLANDYFKNNNSRNYRTWKINFEKYRDAANNNEYSILEDFDHLKANHNLEVGNYDALLDIFQHIDKRAVRRIEQDCETIRCMIRNQ